MQAIGPSLLPWSSEDPNILKFGGAMHAVLVSELKLFDKEEREERECHLQRIVATYMVFAHLPMSAGAYTQISSLFPYLSLTSCTERCNLDENMAELFRTLSPSEFSSCLQFVLEALSSNGIASDGIACLIRLISLALHNAPESQPCLRS
jgi:hypothetical protein